MKIKNGRRELEPGDVICCYGIKCTVKEITYQYDFGEEGFDCEFTDTSGVYRSWKQRIDGGYVIPLAD